MLAVYVTLIIAEGNNSFFEILPWALLMGTASAIAFASAHVVEPRYARNLLVGGGALRDYRCSKHSQYRIRLPASCGRGSHWKYKTLIREQ